MSTLALSKCFQLYVFLATRTTLTHMETFHQLEMFTIPVQNVCGNVRNPSCTSLEGIQQNTIYSLIILKQTSGCRIEVTGGTEIGHTSLTPYTHEDGYRVNIRQNDCLDQYMRTNKDVICRRIDTGNSFVILRHSTCGDIFERWEDHWDVVFSPKNSNMGYDIQDTPQLRGNQLYSLYTLSNEAIVG